MKTINWKIETLRLTSFLENEFEIKYLEKWIDETFNVEPLQISKSPTGFTSILNWESTFVKIEWQKNRVDILINSNNPSTENNIGDFSQFNKYIEKVIIKYFDITDCPNSKRLALGLTLHFHVEDNAEGMKLIQPYIKSLSDVSNIGDFLFRLNKPVKSKANDSININRLLTWSVGPIQLIQIDLNAGLSKPIPAPKGSNLFCRVEMDLNTELKDGINMEVVEQVKLINELIIIANSVAETGEHCL